MRILHVTSGNLYGGVETLLVTLARERNLCPQLQQEFAVCFEGRLVQELESTAVAVHRLGSTRTSRPWTVWQARRRLVEIVRGNFDVVICHMSWSIALFGPAVRASGAKLAFWLHDAATGKNWLERWAASTRPDAAICNSRFTAATLPKLYQGVSAKVIHCPVSQPAAPGAGTVRSVVRQRMGAKESDTVILQVSRMEEWKGHRLLLKALSLLKNSLEWRCWVAGGAQRPKEVEYLENLKHVCTELGIGDRVQFLGQRSDVPDLLAASDIFCQPNTGPEPFGIVFVEALWSGLPVVTTSMGGAVEIVDNTCGILTRPHDDADLAASLKTLIENPDLRLRLGSRGPDRAYAISSPSVLLPHLYRCMSELSASNRSEAAAAATI